MSCFTNKPNYCSEVDSVVKMYAKYQTLYNTPLYGLKAMYTSPYDRECGMTYRDPNEPRDSQKIGGFLKFRHDELCNVTYISK